MNRTKELKRMKRQELLELLLEVTEENESLKKEMQTLKNRLASKEITASKAGSLAEASLQLSGIFEAAQEAASTYLFNLKKANERADEILRNADQEAARIRKRAEQSAVELLERTRRQASEEMKQGI